MFGKCEVCGEQRTAINDCYKTYNQVNGQYIVKDTCAKCAGVNEEKLETIRYSE